MTTGSNGRYAIYRIVFNNGTSAWDYGPAPHDELDVIEGEFKTIHIVERHDKLGECGEAYRKGMRLLYKMELIAIKLQRGGRHPVVEALVSGKGWPEGNYLQAIQLRYELLKIIQNSPIKHETIQDVEKLRLSLDASSK